MKQEYIDFKIECEKYLSKRSLNELRAYGRQIGVKEPTKKSKPDLLAAIIAVLTGEEKPIERSLRGAPIKNDYVDPEIVNTIDRLRHRYFDDEYGQLSWHDEMLRIMKKRGPETISFGDSHSGGADPRRDASYTGQLQTLDGVACLLPLSCRENESLSVVVPVELIRKYDLREGDVLSCQTQKMQSGKGFVVYAVHERNGVALTETNAKRPHFETENVDYPATPISVYDGSNDDVSLKALEWLIPICKGQRACVVSAPKAGKTELLYQIAKATAKSKEVLTYVLLIEQTPETVTKFRALLPEEQIVYTTYEDDEDKQVFTADFLLKRAIRQMESGKDVLLLVDSLSALAHAFNNTDESSGGKVLAGGLESKTVQYLKKYFGTARTLEKGKSLTIVGALSTETGNIVDSVLCSELCGLANLEIHLSNELAIRRIYPAFDFIKTRLSGCVFTDEQNKLDNYLKTEYLPQHGDAELLRALKQSKTFADLLHRVEK